MELLQLKHFVELAESEHLTRTANKLIISPSSLSASISRLEKSIGYSLFEPKGRNIRLNANGQILYKYAKQALNALSLAQSEINSANGVYKNNIGVAYTAPTLWTEGFQAFMKANPTIHITTTQVTLPQLSSLKYQNANDLFITAEDDLPSMFFDSKTIIENDAAGILVRRDHKFASRKHIDLIEAKDEKFVALSQGYSSRKFFDDACHAAGFTPNIVIQCDYILRAEMIAAGYGISFTSRLGHQNTLIKDFVFIPIKNPPIQRKQCVFWKKEHTLSPMAKKFSDFIINYYHRRQG